MSVTLEQDLKEILAKIDQKLNSLQKDIADLKVGKSEIKGEIKTLIASTVLLSSNFVTGCCVYCTNK